MSTFIIMHNGRLTGVTDHWGDVEECVDAFMQTKKLELTYRYRNDLELFDQFGNTPLYTSTGTYKIDEPIIVHTWIYAELPAFSQKLKLAEFMGSVVRHYYDRTLIQRIYVHKEYFQIYEYPDRPSED